MERKKFFPHINALRFVAILSTVTGHWAMDSGLTQNALLLGQYGVDLFFTISGFLITLNLLESMDQHDIPVKKKLAYFFVNRSLRIFPPYFLLLLLLFLIHLILQITVWMKGTGVYYFTYSSNFLFYLNGFPPVSYLNHTWSLAVEEQFYIIWPFLMLLVFPKKTIHLIILFILIGVLAHFLHPLQFGEKYKGYVRLLPFANYHTLGSGALLAFFVWSRHRMLPKLHVLLNPLFWMIIFALSCYSKISMVPTQLLVLLQEIVLCITTMSLVFAGWEGFEGWFKKLFDNAIVQYIGLISYGIYLFETPISFLVLNSADKLHIHFRGESIVRILIFAGATFLAAHLSYNYFELKFLKIKKKYH